MSHALANTVCEPSAILSSRPRNPWLARLSVMTPPCAVLEYLCRHQSALVLPIYVHSADINFPKSLPSAPALLEEAEVHTGET